VSIRGALICVAVLACRAPEPQSATIAREFALALARHDTVAVARLSVALWRNLLDLPSYYYAFDTVRLQLQSVPSGGDTTWFFATSLHSCNDMKVGIGFMVVASESRPVVSMQPFPDLIYQTPPTCA
jgi:hypothetical protein